jgi:serine/threonine-protein kinase HipA
MKIGGEYSSEKVMPRNFDRLAEEAGLGRAQTRKRVPEMTEKVISGLGQVEIAHPVAKKVAELIRQRAERTGRSFQ